MELSGVKSFSIFIQIGFGYPKDMEAYKAMKEEEAETNRTEKEEHLKLQKQETLQLLKKDKTLNIIKKTKDKKKNKKKNDDPNKPKKPASSFLLFNKEARKTLQEERPGITNSTVNAMISVKWKELGEEEKGMWNARAAEAMEGYKKEMEEYNKSVVAAADGGAGGSNKFWGVYSRNDSIFLTSVERRDYFAYGSLWDRHASFSRLSLLA